MAPISSCSTARTKPLCVLSIKTPRPRRSAQPRSRRDKPRPHEPPIPKPAGRPPPLGRTVPRGAMVFQRGMGERGGGQMGHKTEAGRHRNPQAIPASGWRDILLRTKNQIPGGSRLDRRGRRGFLRPPRPVPGHCQSRGHSRSRSWTPPTSTTSLPPSPARCPENAAEIVRSQAREVAESEGADLGASARRSAWLFRSTARPRE